jgi:hypothetical protein
VHAIIYRTVWKKLEMIQQNKLSQDSRKRLKISSGKERKFEKTSEIIEEYRVRVLATDPEARVRFPALPHFLRSSGSGRGSTQPHEHN